MDIELVFKLGAVEVRRQVSVRIEPKEVLRRIQLRRCPDPVTETSYQFAAEIDEALDRRLLVEVARELLVKL